MVTATKPREGKEKAPGLPGASSKSKKTQEVFRDWLPR
jgi:hypothetical protein